MFTDMQRTFDALDSRYKFWDGTLDRDFLQHSLELIVSHTREFHRRIYHTPAKAHAIAFDVMLYLADECLIDESCPTVFRATNAHIKRYFSRYGLDYTTALAPLVEYIEDKRRQRKEENAA